MNIKILVIFLILSSLCFSCDDDSPLEPTPPAQDTPKSTTPKSIPLATGASWEYSVYYFNRIRNVYLSDEKEYGRLEFEVIQELNVNGVKEFEIGLRFALDSLNYWFFSYNSEGRDTTYTRYNPLDTTFYRTIVFANDTIWYKSDDSLYVMIPDSSSKGSALNLELFNAGGRYESGFFNWSVIHNSGSATQRNYRREGHIPWGSEIITAIVRPADGGIFRLEWSARTGHNFGYDRQLKYTLTKYTSGKSD